MEELWTPALVQFKLGPQRLTQLGYSNAHLFRVIIIATIKENSCLFFLQKTEEKSNEIIWKFLKR